jgi:hypothetical protein
LNLIFIAAKSCNFLLLHENINPSGDSSSVNIYSSSADAQTGPEQQVKDKHYN